MKNLILALSIIINMGLAIVCIVKLDKTPQHGLPAKSDSLPDYEIESMKNFTAVYLDKNDSAYKDLWSKAFEEAPEKAFLISCSYYYVTKDTSILKDIVVSTEQLEHVYHRKLVVDANSIEIEGTLIK